MNPRAPDSSSLRLKVLLVTHELSLTGAPRLALEGLRALGTAIDLRTISGSGGRLEGPFRERDQFVSSIGSQDAWMSGTTRPVQCWRGGSGASWPQSWARACAPGDPMSCSSIALLRSR